MHLLVRVEASGLCYTAVGTNVGLIGVGGQGHYAIQIAKVMEAKVGASLIDIDIGAPALRCSTFNKYSDQEQHGNLFCR